MLISKVVIHPFFILKIKIHICFVAVVGLKIDKFFLLIWHYLTFAGLIYYSFSLFYFFVYRIDSNSPMWDMSPRDILNRNISLIYNTLLYFLPYNNFQNFHNSHACTVQKISTGSEFIFRNSDPQKEILGFVVSGFNYFLLNIKRQQMYQSFFPRISRMELWKWKFILIKFIFGIFENSALYCPKSNGNLAYYTG